MPSLPFVHFGASVRDADATALHDRYSRMMKMLREQDMDSAYNLLMTNEWMVVVPRRREKWESVAVNAMGFVGCLLVKTEEMVRNIEEEGAMKALVWTGYEHDGDERINTNAENG